MLRLKSVVYVLDNQPHIVRLLIIRQLGGVVEGHWNTQWESERESPYLIIAVAGDFDAGLLHLHVHHQPFHHRQSVLVVTEVLWTQTERMDSGEVVETAFHREHTVLT